MWKGEVAERKRRKSMRRTDRRRGSRSCTQHTHNAVSRKYFLSAVITVSKSGSYYLLNLQTA
jgi:hypothetical protein